MLFECASANRRSDSGHQPIRRENLFDNFGAAASVRREAIVTAPSVAQRNAVRLSFATVAGTVAAASIPLGRTKNHFNSLDEVKQKINVFVEQRAARSATEAGPADEKEARANGWNEKSKFSLDDR